MSNDHTYKALVFDVDKSLSTIGSVKKQTEVFGIQPVTINGGLDHINKLLDSALEIHKKEIEHPLLGKTGEVEHVITFNKKGRELGANLLIVDTMSMLGTYERSALMKKNNILTMDRQSWGLYGTSMEKFINKLRMCDFPVVVTAHLTSDQDEDGVPIEYPAFKGSIKKDCGRYFDVIAYAKVSKDAQGKATKYSWTVDSDRRHIMAKNRADLLPATIPQNLNYILETYRNNGFPNPKILILGHSGQGKSWSLQTINEEIELES